MKKVVVTEFLDEEALATLRQKCSVVYDPELWERPGDIARQISDAHGLIIRNRTQMTAELVDAAPKLRVVGRLGVGLDNIDMEACARAGVKVCPAIGGNAASVAEYVIAAALMLRRSAFSASKRVLDGEWPRQELGRGHELSGARLGLIGFGSIGQCLATRARALGMKVSALDAQLSDEEIKAVGAEPLSLEAIVRTCDVISLHVPLTTQTEGLIGSAQLAAMKSSAVLINTARGGIVDELALAQALKGGEIAGAALDVFVAEPPSEATLDAFHDAPNLILTPHIAGVTSEANTRVGAMTVNAVLDALGEADQ